MDAKVKSLAQAAVALENSGFLGPARLSAVWAEPELAYYAAKDDTGTHYAVYPSGIVEREQRAQNAQTYMSVSSNLDAERALRASSLIPANARLVAVWGDAEYGCYRAQDNQGGEYTVYRDGEVVAR